LLFVAMWIACDSHRAAATPEATTAPALSPAIRELFEQLNSDNFKQREEASQRLANYGELIRPALLEATRPGQPPELRWRAAQLLCSISWAAPEDPPLVRQALGYYASTDPERRAKAAVQLGLIGQSALDALLRLLHEEPSDDVRWALVQQLRRFTGKEDRLRIQQLEAAGDDPLLLAAAGWAWQGADPARGDALLGRAADLATPHPVEDLRERNTPREIRAPNELQFLLQWLSVRAMHVGDFDIAAHRIRQSILHADGPLSEAMLGLFVLHAEHGPLRGFDEDVRLAGKSFYSPEMMYVIGRMYARHDQPLLATACYRSAGLAALSTQETHLRVARFLTGRRWYDLADVECRQVFATRGPRKLLCDAEAYVLLSNCAAGQGDDARAAESLATALQVIAQVPNTHFTYEPKLRAEIEWHSLRAAMAKQDKAAMSPCVDRLVDFRPTDPEMTLSTEADIDLVVALKMLDRAEEAAKLFGDRFDDYQKQLEAEPYNAELLNNVAWFCSRCDEHTDQAVHWAAEAVRLAPAEAAYRDTAAEATARVGRWSDAVKLEQEALQLQPGDRFMISQLLRFKERAATPDQKMPDEK
jgi:tetratricopeptide (TPR) repeat protein